MNPDITDPAQAATDLRVAANVIAHAGHTRGDEVNSRDGSVCLLGALGVATGTIQIQTELERSSTYFFQTGPSLNVDKLPRIPTRSADTVLALAEVIPDKITRNGYPIDLSEESAVAKVWTWNDHVCTGGEDAQTLLIQAAEKIEANL